MRKYIYFFLMTTLVAVSSVGLAQDQSIIISAKPKLLLPDAEKLLEKIGENGKEINETDNNTRVLDYRLKLDKADDLIGLTLGVKALARNSYTIVHFLMWKDNQTAIETQHWYLYHNGKWSEKQFEELRIYGSRNVSLLYVHLNARGKSKIDLEEDEKAEVEAGNLLTKNNRTLKDMGDYLLESDYSDIAYKVNVLKKLPAPVLDLQAAIAIAQGALQGKIKSIPINIWGGQIMEVDHVPSDVTVLSIQGNPLGSAKELSKQTYDNESRYYWDVSIGLPIAKVKELSYNAEDGTIRATEVDRQKLFLFFNLYPRPIDTKGAKFVWYPHLVGGVALSKKPIDRLFIGGGWGFNLVHIFAGAAFNKVQSPRTLTAGSPASSSQLNADLRSRYEPKFIAGLDLSVRKVIEVLKGKK